MGGGRGGRAAGRETRYIKVIVLPLGVVLLLLLLVWWFWPCSWSHEPITEHQCQDPLRRCRRVFYPPELTAWPSDPIDPEAPRGAATAGAAASPQGLLPPAMLGKQISDANRRGGTPL